MPWGVSQSRKRAVGVCGAVFLFVLFFSSSLLIISLGEIPAEWLRCSCGRMLPHMCEALESSPSNCNKIKEKKERLVD